jgi:dCMP deaminase
VGCEIGKNGGCTRTVHAEANAISFAARSGNSTDGADLFTTHSPCYDCAKLIINAGIVRVVYDVEYRDPRGIDLLREAGIIVDAIEPTG